VAEINMELEDITHTDKTIILKTETKNAEELELEWSLTQNGEEVAIEEFIEGDISIGESNIRFKEKGVYTLTASATDKIGRTFTDTISLVVYPVGSAGFYIPEIFHTDNDVKVEATFGEIEDHTADWTLIKDGETVILSDFVSGKLANDGGTLQFSQKGEYTLKASFTDDGGRTYSYEQAFKVYPVPSVSYTLPQYAHTDSDINVNVDSIEFDGLKIEWLVDNTFGFQDWATYVDGNLDNMEGHIKFKRAGIYELVARVIDETGRVFLFETGDKTEVFPVLDIKFELPHIAYTDSIIDFRTHGNNNVLPVEWSITKDGDPIAENKATDGSLNAHGGKITFLEQGEYVLTATMTDFLKRSFSYCQVIMIKPVVKYSFTMPESIDLAYFLCPKTKRKEEMQMNSELQTLRLFSPLFPHIYRKDEWGDFENDPEDLTAGEVLEYEDEIHFLIQKEKLPSEGERGLAVYLDDNLSQKVQSINPSVEEWNGELWGVTEVQTNGELSFSELAELTDWLSGQFSDGWGEGLEQREIKVDDGQLLG